MLLASAVSERLVVCTEALARMDKMALAWRVLKHVASARRKKSGCFLAGGDDGAARREGGYSTPEGDVGEDPPKSERREDGCKKVRAGGDKGVVVHFGGTVEAATGYLEIGETGDR